MQTVQIVHLHKIMKTDVYYSPQLHHSANGIPQLLIMVHTK